jgi:diguanylate cyclase (GGDEF)-like protein
LPDAPSRRRRDAAAPSPRHRRGIFPTADDPVAGMHRHVFVPRWLGYVLSSFAFAASLRPQDPPAALWLALVLMTALWPPIAHRLAERSPRPGAAELRNLTIDSLAGGFWIAAAGFDPAVSLVLVAMLWVNNLSVGGPWQLLRGAVAQVAGAAVGVGVLGFHVVGPSVTSLVATAPFMVIYPLMVAYGHWRLLGRLAERREAVERSEVLHRQTLDVMPAGVVLWDADDRLVLCNAEFRRQYAPIRELLEPGRTFEEILRHSVGEGMIVAARGREEAWIAERLRDHADPKGPIEREFTDGRWHRLAEQRLPDGGVLVSTMDVSELMRASHALDDARAEAERARDRLQDAIDAMPDAFAMFDAEDRLEFWNESYLHEYAQSSGAARRGVSFESLLRAGLAAAQYPDAVGREEAWLAERLAHHRQPVRPLLQQLPGNRWMRVNERRTREGGVAGTRTDVTDLVRREQQLERLIAERDVYEARLRAVNEQLEQLSDTDPLTSLGNRRLFDRRLAEEWQRARRHGLPLSLLIVDIDHFKAYNDTYGHPAGDRCLRRVADALRHAAQRSSDLVARYGGEEFALLLPHTTFEQAQAAAEHCLQNVKAANLPHIGSPVENRVTISIGLAVAHFDDGERGEGTQEDLSALVQRADAALYEVKRSGRNRVAF